MKALVRVCRSEEHDEMFYTLCDTCPECGAGTRNTAPPGFSPEDPYAEHRRSAKWKK
jgi:rRNA maturation protein Nop10